MTLDARLEQFQAQLGREQLQPDTIYRYAVAIRELEGIAALLPADDSEGPRESSLVLHYVGQLINRDLAHTTILARLGRVATFLRWLGEEQGSPSLLAVAETIREVRHRYQAHRGHIAELENRSDELEYQAPWEYLAGLGIGSPRGREGDRVLLRALQHRIAPNTSAGDDGPPLVQGRDGTGGAPATEGGREEIRYLHGRAPDRTTPNAQVDVLVSIRRDAGGGSTVTALKGIVVPPEGLTMHLLVSAPTFVPLSEQFVAVHVPQGGDSEWVTFSLSPTTEGIHPVEVHVLNGGTHLGSVVMQIAVAADPGYAVVVDRTDIVDVRPQNKGEISLFVDYAPTGSPPVLRYRLTHSGASPDWISHDGLAPDVTKQVEHVIGELGQLAADASKLSAKLRKERIEQHGAKLWDNFMPKELQAQFWSVADRITRLTIVSSLDPIPWELLYPLARGQQDRGFLVDWIEVVRRHSGEGFRSPRLKLPYGRTMFVVPVDSPKAAAKEIARLRSLDAGLAGGDTVATAEQFTDAIKSADFDLMHFACHNSFRPGSSALKLGGVDIDTTFMAKAEIRRALADRSPLVFMNACHSAGHAPVYTSIDGWAHSFARAGAGAFIGTLWLVRDSSAYTFAEAFYSALVDKATLGAALKAARQKARSEVGDPTWLAYAAYGDPDATLQREV